VGRHGGNEFISLFTGISARLMYYAVLPFNVQAFTKLVLLIGSWNCDRLFTGQRDIKTKALGVWDGQCKDPAHGKVALVEDRVLRVAFLSHDRGLGEAVARALGNGFVLVTAWARQAADLLSTVSSSDVLFLDLRPSDYQTEEEGLRRLEEVCAQLDHPPILVLCDTENRDLTLRATVAGAIDCVPNTPNIVELRVLLRRAYRVFDAERELRRIRFDETRHGHLHDLLGSSPAMLDLFAMVRRVGPCDVNVHITGETGTGKELLARALHELGPRSSGPMVAFSCANLPESLVEDELFGHEKGAFTGAIHFRQGRIEGANHGTLFLDEIGDMGLGLQPKLLRVLQEKSFERIGGNKTIAADVRVICATNRNLREMVAQGKFREDLYYRLNVVELQLPALRERRDDIPFLVHHFIKKSAERFNKKELRVTQAAMNALEQYHWPGNVRELENAIQRAMVLADGNALELSHLPSLLREASASLPVQLPHNVLPNAEEEAGDDELTPPSNSSYEEQTRQFRRNLVIRTLQQNGWRKAETARALGVARGYLHRLINQLDIKQESESRVDKPLQRRPIAPVM
jgi:DNA-binding NtrC family response regulator